MDELYHTAQQLPLFATSKVCIDCHIDKPLDQYYCKKEWYEPRCKRCKNDKNNAARRVRYQKYYLEPRDNPRNKNKRIPTKEGCRFCSICEQEKPIEEFHLLRGKPRAVCIDCERARNRERSPLQYKRVNPVIPKATQEGHKVCNTCLNEKPFEAFDRNLGIKDGHKGRCKDCTKGEWDALSEEEKNAKRLMDRQSRVPRREQILERDRKRHKTEIDRARRREAIAMRKANDPLYKESIALASAEWRRNHPLAMKESSRKIKAKRKGVKTERVSYKRILERYGMWCYICEKPILTEKDMQFDHVIPLSPRPGEPQGTHSEDNIKPTHSVCNNRKKNKPFSTLTPLDRRGVD